MITTRLADTARRYSWRAALALGAFAIGVAVLGLASVRRPYGDIVVHKITQPPRSAIVATPAKFRVASFNIHSGRGADGRRDLGRTARALANVDIAGLNEVRGPSILGGLDQASDLGARLGLAAVFGPSERRWYVTSFGNGLLSGFPILSWRSRPMRASRAGSYRAVISAKAAIGGKTVEVIVAHVEPGEIREAQLRELGHFFAGVRPPALLIGDFNAHLQHPELRRIGTLPGVLHAMTSGPIVVGSSGHIDHIFAKGLRLAGAGATVTDASDHPLVWADLELSTAIHPELRPGSVHGGQLLGQAAQ